jgi:hypothetical protein
MHATDDLTHPTPINIAPIAKVTPVLVGEGPRYKRALPSRTIRPAWVLAEDVAAEETGRDTQGAAYTL